MTTCKVCASTIPDSSLLCDDCAHSQLIVTLPGQWDDNLLMHRNLVISSVAAISKVSPEVGLRINMIPRFQELVDFLDPEYQRAAKGSDCWRITIAEMRWWTIEAMAIINRAMWF